MMAPKKRLSRLKYSTAVFGYVPNAMGQDLEIIRQIDPGRYSKSQVIENALASYLPTLKAQLGISFNGPIHGTPGSRRRRL